MPPRHRTVPGTSGHKGTRTKRFRPWRAVLLAIILLFLAGLVAGSIYIFRLYQSLPSVANLGTLMSQNSTIYGLNDQPVMTLQGQQNRVAIPLSQISKTMQEAIVATEDKRFWTNVGIDPRSILRSALADLRHGSAVQGASTISEQLGKSLFLTDNKGFSYKIKEILLGLDLERTYTKPEILDMYLNQIYLGEGAFGVDAAARTYFGVSASQLDLPQAALLAGLPKAPSLYDPYVNPKLAIQRRNVVLGLMAQQGYITAAQASAAARAPLNLVGVGPGGVSNNDNAYFVDDVVRILLKHFTQNQVYSGGLKIYTTLDPAIQAAAVHAINAVMGPAKVPVPEPEAAVIAMDPTTGYVLADVGGRTHPYAMGLNRATGDFRGDFYRQTGSSIKPLAEYTTAIENGYTPLSVIDDGPWLLVHGKPWPTNDDFIYRGRITLAEALAISDNNASVRLLKDVGVNAGFYTATKKFGLPLIGSGAVNDRNLAMGIGGLTRGVTVLQMADAYSTFDNQGVRPKPIFVRKVLNQSGDLLWSDPPQLHAEISPQVAYVMTKMMEGVIQYGTGDPDAQIGRPAAGKTGTSSNGVDGWFVGYVPGLVVAAWEGNDNHQPQPGVYGATYAGPIWRLTMLGALAHQKARNFPRPNGLARITVDIKSGLLPSPLTPAKYIKTFWAVAGTQPTKISNVWTKATVTKQDPHELYSPACVGLTPMTRVFLKRPTDILIGPRYQLPIDASLWVPTKSCTGQTVPAHVGRHLPGSAGQNATPAGSGSGAAGTSTTPATATGSTQTTPSTSPSSPSTSAGSSTQSPASSPGTTTQNPASNAPVQLNLTIQNDLFSPPTLQAPVNSKITLLIQNQDAVPYSFDLPGFGIQGLNIPANGNAQVTFTSGPTGAYLFDLSGSPPVDGVLNIR